jgi:molybdopterin converting factor subunit 1
MDLNVLLFASWAEALGGAEVTLTLPEPATVADVLREAERRVAGRPLPRPMVAVNHRYAKPETPVRPGDEVAIIPPVAGG